ncbi:hypothetical protein caldi_13210 [Caldinitratiruptor microaerophilus]|uniref:Thiamin/hydroxymethyl pyrimidine-binding YkoF putative domain-containing protein n=1 Tax=Caldinitratiruptor microaerophilus TaxID=671077 RepID=A0AA35G7L9_9FIRM|nr:hypothetical protein caldi_13210 [Caldinitratiruptor microaerophilus]
MLSCQVSLYPLGTAGYDGVIREAVRALDDPRVRVTVGEMSSVLVGEDDAVWQALRRLFEAAAAGPVVMVATLSNECGCRPG